MERISSPCAPEVTSIPCAASRDRKALAAKIAGLVTAMSSVSVFPMAMEPETRRLEDSPFAATSIFAAAGSETQSHVVDGPGIAVWLPWPKLVISNDGPFNALDPVGGDLGCQIVQGGQRILGLGLQALCFGFSKPCVTLRGRLVRESLAG